MPSRNQRKEYLENFCYHLYNRGVGKMRIFHDEQDYKTFLHYLRLIFSPEDVLTQEFLFTRKRSRQTPSWQPKVRRLERALRQARKYKLWEKVELLSFCLMPTHFHLLVYQKIKNGIELVMRRLGPAYSNYYTNKYDWVGPVVQGRYNASCLSWDPRMQPLAAGKYVETNPTDLIVSEVARKRSRQTPLFSDIGNYPYSSLNFYKSELIDGHKSPIWLSTERLLKIFEEVRENPQSMLEETVATHDNYLDFILSPVDISLEDVRFSHLAEHF